MLNSKYKGLLEIIIEHSKKILLKSKDIDEENFLKNDDVKQILCFNLLQIGELVKHFDEDFIQKYSKIPWKNIKGLRDRIAHGYGSIDFKKVWITIKEDVPPLLEYCLEIINLF